MESQAQENEGSYVRFQKTQPALNHRGMVLVLQRLRWLKTEVNSQPWLCECNITKRQKTSKED